MTVERYQKLMKQESPSEEDTMCIMFGLTPEQLNTKTDAEVDNLKQQLTEALTSTKLHTTFKINGIEYGLIPNFDLITYGENRDLTDYLSDWDNMHRALAVAYRPISLKKGEKYIIEPYKGTEETRDLFKKLPLEIPLGLNVFFYNLMKDLLKAFPNYMEEEVLPQNLDVNGEDMKKCMNSLRETLEGLEK